MALSSEIAALIETYAANEADYTAPEFKKGPIPKRDLQANSPSSPRLFLLAA